MFRNKEIRLLSFCFVLWFIIALILSIMLEKSTSSILIIATLGYSAMFYYFVRWRYHRISELTEEIDQVLHHSEKVFISQEEEGELSILESEIAKMTIRIRDQNEALLKEKKHLADALADIAHQLRTPLTAAELIVNRLDCCENKLEHENLLQEISALFRQMDQLLTILLKLSRLDAGIVSFEKADIIVMELIEQVARRCAISMELHDIDLEIEMTKDIKIYADPIWMAEAIQNIIKNAIESIGNGGSISISAQSTPLYTEIVISDNGPGLSQQDLLHLFERFYRGRKSTSTGFGVGLALSKAIIVHLGGTIQAKNRVDGHGAMFIIRF